MRALHIVPLVALAALLVPNWCMSPERAWAGVLGYFGGILITLLVLIVLAIRRERKTPESDSACSELTKAPE